MERLELIGRQIAEARRQARRTQQGLAEKAGISVRTIRQLEAGRAPEIGYGKLVRVLAAVGLELTLGPVKRDRPTLDDLLREDSSSD
jgi:transcriptional regulator with XRE-family HTH domain